MFKEIAVVCAGTKFNVHLHIRQKYLQLKKYCDFDFRLSVLTDDSYSVNSIGLDNVRVISLPNWSLAGPQKLWWYKIYMFSPEIDWQGSVLYLDLDTIVIGNLKKFWEFEKNKLCILQDFNRMWIPNYPVSNSSIIRFDPKKHQKVFHDFKPETTPKSFRGDQDYLTWWFKDKPVHAWWPRDWAMSYKWELLHGGAKHGSPGVQDDPQNYLQPDTREVIPNDCSIAVFHGLPDPYETDFGKDHFIG